MTTIDIDESLRAQSKLLLRKLKDKQGKLQNIVQSSSRSPEVQTGSGQRDRQDESLQTIVGSQSREGRYNLKQKSRSSKAAKGKINCSKHDEKENLVENHQKESFGSKNLEMDVLKNGFYDADAAAYSDTEEVVTGESETKAKSLRTSEDEHAGIPSSTTPNTIRRRKIIDRNVRVGKDLNLDETAIMKECEEDYNRLNFSYSGVADSDLQFLESRLGKSSEPGPVSETAGKRIAPEADECKYKEKLENAGNSRKYAKFIRETNRPKSILLSTSQRQNKSNSKVSFNNTKTSDTSGHTYSMDSTMKDNQKMLGYDWIAGLLDNDSNAVNQSESYFEDLREFRRVNLEECVNQLYMDGPSDLWEHPERESSPVARALEETKVKPYMVNERLFTEPIKRSLFADYEVDETPQRKEKEPTYDEPRFVRVSIPRSTLLSPHRVKPHRRRSFEPTDTMSLTQHCLKGCDTSSVSMVPTASTIGLRDCTTGIRSTMKTTLHDAEKLAANYPYHWDPSEQKLLGPTAKLAYRPEEAYNSMSNINVTQNDSALFGSTKELKKATDDLLNSTYSLMYEMQKLKTERDVDPVRINRKI